MCSPATPDNFPQDQRPLFTFIAQKLHNRIAARPSELVLDTCNHCHVIIAKIIADQQRRKSRRQKPERVQETRKRKIRKRTERYARAAGHLNAKRREAAETACAPPEETATFALTTGDPVNEDEETPCTDFDYDCDSNITAAFQQ
jgi:hypothetical protein